MRSFKLVGDNIDKTVKPREMRMDAQSKSLHYFNAYAVKNRLSTAELEDNPSLHDFSTFQASTLLPSEADLTAIQKNLAVLTSRVLKKHFPFFAKFGVKMERHIKHKHYKQMCRKSDVVCIINVPIHTSSKKHFMKNVKECRDVNRQKSIRTRSGCFRHTSHTLDP